MSVSLQTQQRKLAELKRGDYFVIENDLYYLKEVLPEKDYFLIEDCMTLKESFLKHDTASKIYVREVHGCYA
jgi:hypothetical protein